MAAGHTPNNSLTETCNLGLLCTSLPLGNFLRSTSREFLATLTSGGLKYLDNQPDDEEDKHCDRLVSRTQRNAPARAQTRTVRPGVHRTNH